MLRKAQELDGDEGEEEDDDREPGQEVMYRNPIAGAALSSSLIYLDSLHITQADGLQGLYDAIRTYQCGAHSSLPSS